MCCSEVQGCCTRRAGGKARAAAHCHGCHGGWSTGTTRSGLRRRIRAGKGIEGAAHLGEVEGEIERQEQDGGEEELGDDHGVLLTDGRRRRRARRRSR